MKSSTQFFVFCLRIHCRKYLHIWLKWLAKYSGPLIVELSLLLMLLYSTSSEAHTLFIILMRQTNISLIQVQLQGLFAEVQTQQDSI